MTSIEEMDNIIRDQPIRQKLADKLVPPGTSERCHRATHHLRELRRASTSVAASSTPITTFARPRAPPPLPCPRAPPRLHGRRRRSSASTAATSTRPRAPPRLHGRRRRLHERRRSSATATSASTAAAPLRSNRCLTSAAGAASASSVTAATSTSTATAISATSATSASSTTAAAARPRPPPLVRKRRRRSSQIRAPPSTSAPRRH
ncbi:hypothetical protein DAI22_03g090550 [Oryza sativa Japonica Group]|nr:hypothetical protein DAI22_03g090550 [Oryza sativa Japonica Group]